MLSWSSMKFEWNTPQNEIHLPGIKRERYSFLPDEREYNMAGYGMPLSIVSIHRVNLQHMILLPDHSLSQSLSNYLTYRMFNTKKSSSSCVLYCPKRNFVSLFELVIECWSMFCLGLQYFTCPFVLTFCFIFLDWTRL